jgi:glyoxylase-like metal-dependent hydrolase (beta-lactamase superfamily II)
MRRLPQRIATGVYQIPLGGVNAFLIDLDDDGEAGSASAAGGGTAPGGLVLIDTGFARSGPRIGQAIHDLGRAPGDVRAIVVTHLHGDHTGALTEVKTRTGAEVWMHPADAALVREGVFSRPLEPGPGLSRSAIAGLVNRRRASPGEPIAVEHWTAKHCRSPACAPCIRRGTRPAIWRCCCRGKAACSSSATPPPTSRVSAGGRSTKT